MDTLNDLFSGVAGWEFLSEPLYRWFLFLGALLALAWSWNGILDFARS